MILECVRILCKYASRLYIKDEASIKFFTVVFEHSIYFSISKDDKLYGKHAFVLKCRYQGCC